MIRIFDTVFADLFNRPFVVADALENVNIPLRQLTKGAANDLRASCVIPAHEFLLV